jgi:hypothetical protein
MKLGAALLVGLILALGGCALPPNSLNDHPYRDLPSGPNCCA